MFKLKEIMYSRYGDPRFIFTDEDKDQELTMGFSRFFRGGCDPTTGEIEFVDFEGGPFIPRRSDKELKIIKTDIENFTCCIETRKVKTIK